MPHSIIAIALAFLGYSLLNIGQAGQKIGLGLRRQQPLLGWGIWGSASAATGVSFLLVFAAISLGSVSTVGAMAATGLASLAVFSRIVMKETLTRTALIAIAAIITAAAVLALFDQPVQPAPNRTRLYALLGIGTLVYSGLIFTAPSHTIRGAAIGGLSGFLGAGSQLFQRLGTIDTDPAMGLHAFATHVLGDPITIAWIGLSLISMLVMQFSYRHAQAVQIVPVFTANFILLPAVGGVIAFGERLHPVQWIAVAIMLVGAIAITRTRRSRRTRRSQQ